MNPLQRRLFRLQQPGMSRQPMGILASSPELMQAAQRGATQPLKMNQGGSVSQYMQAIQQLKQAGDKATLNNIAADQRLPRSVQMAAANALSGISGPSQAIPIMDDNPPGPRPDVAQRARTMAGIASQDRTGTPVFNNPDDADQLKRAFMYPGEVIGMRVPSDAPGKPNPIGQGIRGFFFGTEDRQSPVQSALRSVDDAIVGATSAAGDLIQDAEAGLVSAFTPQATESALAKGQAEGMSRRGDFPDRPSGDLPTVVKPEAEAPATDAKEKEDKTPDPVTAAEKIITDPSTLLPQISTTLGDKDKTNKQKADATDAALGIKGTRKERTEQRYEMLKDLLGEDRADDIRTDVGYNLMMTGLMIAAGQSPDAMTNIAGGLAKGLAGYGKAAGEAAQAESKEEKALKLMAAKEVGAEITAEEAARIRAQELADERSFKEEMQQERLDATKEIKEMGGETTRIVQAIADTQDISFGEAALLYKRTGASATGGAYSPERFAQTALDTAADREAIMLEMMTAFPEVYDPKAGGKEPTTGQMLEYVRQQASGGTGASAGQQTQAVDVNAHQAANAAAKQAGQPTYTVDGKSYKVQ